MGMYLMMMYVSLEQEEAVKHFFSTKGWSFQKPDLSVLTDRTGPLVIPVSEPTLAITDTGTPEQTEAGRKPVTATHTSTSAKTKTSPQQQQKKGKVTATKRSANTEKREFEEILKEAEIIAASVSEIGECEENEGTETSVKMEQERESFIMEQTDNYDDTYDDYDDFNGGEKGETEVSKIEFVKDSVTQGPSDDTLTRGKRKLGDRSELSEMEDFGDSQEAAIKVKRRSTISNPHNHLEAVQSIPRTRGQLHRHRVAQENSQHADQILKADQEITSQLPSNGKVSMSESPVQFPPPGIFVATDKQSFQVQLPTCAKDQETVRQNSPLTLPTNSKSLETSLQSPVQLPTYSKSLETSLQSPVQLPTYGRSLETVQHRTVQLPSQSKSPKTAHHSPTQFSPSRIQENIQLSSVDQLSTQLNVQETVQQKSPVQLPVCSTSLETVQHSPVQLQLSKIQENVQYCSTVQLPSQVKIHKTSQPSSPVLLPTYSIPMETVQQSSVQLPTYSRDLETVIQLSTYGQTLETVQQTSVELPTYKKALETIQQPPTYSKAVETVNHSLLQFPPQDQSLKTVQQTLSVQSTSAAQQTLSVQSTSAVPQPLSLQSTSADQQSYKTSVFYEAVSGPTKQENDSITLTDQSTSDLVNAEDHFKVDSKRYCGANPEEPLFIKFTELEEKNVVDFLLLLYNLGYGFTKLDMARIATEYAVYLRKRTKTQPIVMHWVTEMMRKWPELQLVRKKCKLNLTGILSKFFNNLENVMIKCSFDDRPKLVFSVTDIEIRQDDAESGEEKILTTVIACGSAAGLPVPPFFVFPGQKMSKDLMNQALLGSSGVVSPDGLVNAEVFIHFLNNHLLKNIPEEDIGKPILIHMNAVKFCSVGLLDLAKRHNVMLIFPPSEIPNALMPLDVGCIEAFQTEYTRECEKHIQETMTDITMNNVCCIVGKIYTRALTSKNIKEGFRRAGLFPCDRGMLIVKRKA